MCVASNLEQPKEKQCFCSPRASILDPSYTYVNKGSPPSLVFFEIIIFKMRRAGPGAPYLRGPRAAFWKWWFPRSLQRVVLDLSYTYVNKGSPPTVVFFEMNIFKMRRAWPGAHVLKGPRAAFWKCSFLKLIRTFGVSRPILHSFLILTCSL